MVSIKTSEGFIRVSFLKLMHTAMLHSAYITHIRLQNLKLSNIKVKKLAGGLQEVSAVVENKRMLPTHSASNLKFKIDPPDYIFLDGGTVIAGMFVEDKDRNINREQKKNPQRLEVQNIAGIKE